MRTRRPIFSYFSSVRGKCSIGNIVIVFLIFLILFIFFVVQNTRKTPVYVMKGGKDPLVSIEIPQESKDPLFEFAIAAFQKLGAGLKEGDEWDEFIQEAFRLPGEEGGDKWNRINTYAKQITARLRKIHGRILERSPEQVPKRRETRTKINLAAVACGDRREQALTMVKSAALFSQDADLHLIAFGDTSSVLNLAEEILELRWRVNAAGWDFTYELHLDWFPPEVDWKKMYAPCATQRLFFPSLLEHIDALIYLDSDIVVLSNMTDFWNHLVLGMGDKKMAGASPNNEPTAWGWYNGGGAKIPYYSTHGLNAGVMLMNLTQMRIFKMQERCVAAHAVYEDKLGLADQDIYNIIFHTYPEFFHEFSCSYNFNWVHCGFPDSYSCYDQKGVHTCFCHAVEKTGVHIVHGNSGTFTNEYLHFMKAIYEGFQKFEIGSDSPVELVKTLREDYLAKPQNHCHILTADMLYKNAETYLHNLYDSDV